MKRPGRCAEVVAVVVRGAVGLGGRNWREGVTAGAAGAAGAAGDGRSVEAHVSPHGAVQAEACPGRTSIRRCDPATAGRPVSALGGRWRRIHAAAAEPAGTCVRGWPGARCRPGPGSPTRSGNQVGSRGRRQPAGMDSGISQVTPSGVGIDAPWQRGRGRAHRRSREIPSDGGTSSSEVEVKASTPTRGAEFGRARLLCQMDAPYPEWIGLRIDVHEDGAKSHDRLANAGGRRTGRTRSERRGGGPHDRPRRRRAGAVCAEGGDHGAPMNERIVMPASIERSPAQGRGGLGGAGTVASDAGGIGP